MLLLGVDISSYGVRAVLLDHQGKVAARGRARVEDSLEAAAISALAPCLQSDEPFEAAVAMEGCATEPLVGLLGQADCIWFCRPEEAQLCAYLGCRPGIVVVAGMQARALGIDRTFRPMQLEQNAGAALWLADEAVAARGQSVRLHNTLRRDFPTVPEGPRRAALCRTVLELAEFPGPETVSRGLVVRAARRLTELTRFLVGRMHTSVQDASWAGMALQGPLLEAFLQEVERYLPQLRWRKPRFEVEEGAALLALAGREHRQRSHQEFERARPVDDNVWRYVLRMRKPLPLLS